MGEEGIALEHGVQWSLVRRHSGYVLAVQHYAAFVGLKETGYHTQQGGLSAARRPQKGDELTAADIQIDVVEHLLVTE